MHILIIGGGREIPGRIRAAGARTTTICRHIVLDSVREPEANTSLHSLPDDSNPDTWVALARHLHAADPFDAVACFSEIDQDKAAGVAVGLGLRGHEPETVAAIQNKAQMRARLKDAGLTSVQVAEVRSAEDVLAAGASNGWPLVLKPVSGWASAGVSVLRGPDELVAAWDRAVNAKVHQGRALMVETFLPGVEFSVEALSEDADHLVVAITGKISDPITRVELGHVVPGRLDTTAKQAIEDAVVAALTALGVRDGISHTEVILAADGTVELIETHVRPPGDSILDLVEDAYGVDVIDESIRQLLGKPVLEAIRSHLAATEPRGAAIRFLASSTTGTVTSIDGVEVARNLPGVHEVSVGVAVGDRVAPPQDSFGRVGHLRTRAATGEEAELLANAALKTVIIGVSAEQCDAPS